MKLILEVFAKKFDEKIGEEVETIVHSEEVESKEHAIKRKNKLLDKYPEARFMLHYCYHDESPLKPCRREVL